MASITITNVERISNGVRIHGHYDDKLSDVISVKVVHRLSNANRGIVESTEQGDKGCVRINSTKHNLKYQDNVRVFGVKHTPEANGTWKVRDVTENEFDLLNSEFSIEQSVAAGEWFIDDLFDSLAVKVDGDPPARSWVCDVVLSRIMKYHFKAILFRHGSPSVVSSAEYYYELT
ncbi:hypothetical protein V6x_51580 [Gimesia chilikensis]|uniref:Uncharacterized protein n=1 Tax=Gimesia chilikensis TaxID=2605989 RepID=A0A517WJJ1_9PLAN|nr:hypothetical protein [Gimesia chilikensis]KAA0134434.1 hypothetical protein FYZ48_20285 [Gimesia chilikensis]QDU05421.1 hypothetical protein V6x_51580 [Gimesia chilikensis]